MGAAHYDFAKHTNHQPTHNGASPSRCRASALRALPPHHTLDRQIFLPHDPTTRWRWRPAVRPSDRLALGREAWREARARGHSARPKLIRRQQELNLRARRTSLDAAVMGGLRMVPAGLPKTCVYRLRCIHLLKKLLVHAMIRG